MSNSCSNPISLHKKIAIASNFPKKIHLNLCSAKFVRVVLISDIFLLDFELNWWIEWYKRRHSPFLSFSSSLAKMSESLRLRPKIPTHSQPWISRTLLVKGDISEYGTDSFFMCYRHLSTDMQFFTPKMASVS